MKKRRYLPQLIAVVALVAFSSIFSIHANGNKETPDKSGYADIRADIIPINTLKSFGPLERNEVFFSHDTHTEALEKINKGCETCHLTREVFGRQILSPKFKRLKDESREQVIDIYHNNCIACHKEMYSTGNKTGPVELCGECHSKVPEDKHAWEPMEFNKYLHSYHMELKGKDCSACHHDNKKEASCRYCHKVGSNIPVSMETASHISCIGCHRKTSGPTKCRECHDIDKQKKFDRSRDVPRLMRDQPDAVLMGINSMDKDTEKSSGITPVPFNHKTHEQSQDTCRICHHSSIESCSKSCHTSTGSEKGNMIRSEQAMHDLDSERSCLGCHEINKEQKECAGCHGLMDRDSSLKKGDCSKCHMAIPKESETKNLSPESIASMLIKSREIVSDSLDYKDIPETVDIKELSSQYGPVELPHRQIINSLMGGIKDNKLASYFHGEKKTVCQACHHNSPATMTPPGCSSCHGKPFDELNPLRPGLKAAFHQQCMDCHESMDIEEPESADCVACHKVTGTNKLYDF